MYVNPNSVLHADLNCGILKTGHPPASFLDLNSKLLIVQLPTPLLILIRPLRPTVNFPRDKFPRCIYVRPVPPPGSRA